MLNLRKKAQGSNITEDPRIPFDIIKQIYEFEYKYSKTQNEQYKKFYAKELEKYLDVALPILFNVIEEWLTGHIAYNIITEEDPLAVQAKSALDQFKTLNTLSEKIIAFQAALMTIHQGGYSMVTKFMAPPVSADGYQWPQVDRGAWQTFTELSEGKQIPEWDKDLRKEGKLKVMLNLRKKAGIPLTLKGIVSKLNMKKKANRQVIALSKWHEIASNPSTPPEMLQQLSTDKNYHIRYRVANNPNTPKEVLTKLSTDKEWYVRQNVASNPSTPPEMLQQLSTDSAFSVRQSVATNPNTSPELLHQLSTDPKSVVKEAVIYNRNTSLETLQQLVTDEDKGVRRYLAAYLNTPIEVLTILSTDKDSSVRWAVAHNPNTPPETLQQLATDEDKGVRKIVVENASTPFEVLEQFIPDIEKNINIAYSFARNYNTPPELLTQLATHKAPFIRAHVAYNPNTPKEVLPQLAADPNLIVGAAAAKNPNTPPDAVKVYEQAQLLDDQAFIANNQFVRLTPEGRLLFDEWDGFISQNIMRVMRIEDPSLPSYVEPELEGVPLQYPLGFTHDKFSALVTVHNLEINNAAVMEAKISQNPRPTNSVNDLAYIALQDELPGTAEEIAQTPDFAGMVEIFNGLIQEGYIEFVDTPMTSEITFDLPGNLPEGIALRLNMKKYTLHENWYTLLPEVQLRIAMSSSTAPEILEDMGLRSTESNVRAAVVRNLYTLPGTLTKMYNQETDLEVQKALTENINFPSTIKERPTTEPELGYSWGPEGPPSGIVNAVRLNMKKSADVVEDPEDRSIPMFPEDLDPSLGVKRTEFNKAWKYMAPLLYDIYDIGGSEAPVEEEWPEWLQDIPLGKTTIVDVEEDPTEKDPEWYIKHPEELPDAFYGDLTKKLLLPPKPFVYMSAVQLGMPEDYKDYAGDYGPFVIHDKNNQYDIVFDEDMDYVRYNAIIDNVDNALLPGGGFYLMDSSLQHHIKKNNPVKEAINSLVHRYGYTKIFEQIIPPPPYLAENPAKYYVMLQKPGKLPASVEPPQDLPENFPPEIAVRLNMKKAAGAYLTPKGKEMLTELEQPSQEEELLFSVPDTSMQTVLMMVALNPSISLNGLLSDVDAYSDDPEEEREDIIDTWARAIDEGYMLYEEPTEYPTGDVSTLPLNLPSGITAVRLNMKKNAQPDEDKDELDLADDPQTSPEVLEHLAKSEDDDVRGMVANNSNTPVHVLRNLSYDLEWYDSDVEDEIRTIPYMLAKNYNTPLDVLTNLYKAVTADMDRGSIWSMIMINPNTPLEMAGEIFVNDDVREELKGGLSPYVASMVPDRERIENRLRELEQRTGIAFFEGKTFDDYEKQERKDMQETLESIDEDIRTLKDQPWISEEDIIVHLLGKQENESLIKEKLPEAGEEYDLPENLPPGIAVRLNMKVVSLNMKKTALEIGGETFPDALKFKDESTSPFDVETTISSLYQEAESFVVNYIWSGLQAQGILGPDEANVIQTDVDTVRFSSASSLVNQLMEEGWFKYLEQSGNARLKSDPQLQQQIYNSLQTAIKEGAV